MTDNLARPLNQPLRKPDKRAFAVVAGGKQPCNNRKLHSVERYLARQIEASFRLGAPALFRYYAKAYFSWRGWRETEVWK